MGWYGFDQDRDWWKAFLNTVLSLQVPSNVWTFLSSYSTGGFSRWDQFHGISVLVLTLSVSCNMSANDERAIS
jgi:hypothetical protein